MKLSSKAGHYPGIDQLYTHMLLVFAGTYDSKHFGAGVSQRPARPEDADRDVNIVQMMGIHCCSLFAVPGPLFHHSQRYLVRSYA